MERREKEEKSWLMISVSASVRAQLQDAQPWEFGHRAVVRDNGGAFVRSGGSELYRVGSPQGRVDCSELRGGT